MSRGQRTASPARCAAVWAVALAALAVVVRIVGRDLVAVRDALASGRLTEATFSELLVWAASCTLLGCAAWLAAVTGVVAAGAARGRPDLARPGCPAFVRRAVLVACGAGLAAGLTAPVHADSTVEGSAVSPVFTASASAGARRDATVLQGLPLPDRVEGSRRHAKPVAPPPAPAPSAAGTVIVQPGDSLWSIAAATLPPDASTGEINARWHAIHAENRSVVGDDPDLIHPTTELRIPRG